MEQHLAQQLNQHSIKPTAMRILVLEKLQKQSSAESISDLEVQLEPTERATLYRTLRTFEQHGIVHHIDDGTGVTKYALCSSACSIDAHRDMHVHFHCTTCGSTICLPDTHIPELPLPDRYRAEQYELVIHGTCAYCP